MFRLRALSRNIILKFIAYIHRRTTIVWGGTIKCFINWYFWTICLQSIKLSSPSPNPKSPVPKCPTSPPRNYKILCVSGLDPFVCKSSFLTCFKMTEYLFIAHLTLIVMYLICCIHCIQVQVESHSHGFYELLTPQPTLLC